ncbi:phospholipid-transporting ATPase VA isoform X3 [Castor canadensis]|uniref:Phospholipid-transporting ATPase VA isoform X3 n=1 Tax=Castor canadensis TaxID=51338 RepID=A0AC58LLV5_CASCN
MERESSAAEEPGPPGQRRRRRRREGRTRTVRSNLLPFAGAEDPGAGAVKGERLLMRGCSQHLADNRLKTTKYTMLSFLPKNLFEQFHRLANVYFVFIALLNFVPAVNAFQPGLALAPVLFILAVTAIKDLWEDYSRHRSDHEINHLGCLVFSREEKKYVNRFWKEIHVGDFVRLRCNEIIPADILLLSSSDPDGLCHIETANLDGETNLKRRQVVRGFSELVSEFDPLTFTSVIECEKPNNDLTRFRGCIIHNNGKKSGLHKENLLLRGCTIRNTEAVVGIVVYAGHETKALLNNSGPRYKRSQLERQMNCDVLWTWIVGTAVSSEEGIIPRPRVRWQFFIPSHSCSVLIFDNDNSSAAQRLARYQEVDSEEEEVVPKGGMSQRGSVGSHQSVRTMHRTQSLKSHRRTGSRAEARRASMLSKHTAFSSPMEKDITPDPKLLEKVGECDRCLAIARHQEHPMAHLSPELCDVFDFFIALTVCNTVVVTSPDQPRQKVRVRFELKSPVKTIEDFLRRFSPSRLTSGSSSAGSLVTKSSQKSGSSFLSSLSHDSMLFGLEERLGQPTPAISSNGFSSQAGQADGWAPECTQDEHQEQEQELWYEAESPDEAALVYAARAYNCTLVDRLHDQVSVELPQLGTLTFELLHTLGFDSIRKRMSVVIRNPLTDEISVYTKGADSVVMDLLLPCSSDDARGRHQKKIRSKTQNYLNLYAVEGLRTLCIAKRVLSKEEYACWLQSHLEAESAVDNREELLFQSAIRLETSLQLLGATGIEDRLQDGVPETIAKLRQAGLQIWVLTGDKQETAINIAYACKLLDHGEEVITLNAESQEACAALLDQCLHYVQSRGPPSTPENTKGNVSVGFSPLHQASMSTASEPSPSLVIDGRSLAYALEKNLEDKFLFLAKKCRSVLCCRSTPLQKSMVVKLVRSKLKAMTLAIGDGANDVSMIQVADVGVGISGQEGMQAVMASDFALPRFRYLEKLLIVHGHWCYSRLANMVLYFFYKNTMFVGLLFWFQFYCGFSASAMIDQWYLIFFNLLFSSLPQLVTGVLDKDVPAEVLMHEPQLYKSGQNMEEYRPCAFWLNMVDAAFQSLVCFFIPYLAYYDSDVDMFTWGTPITAIALFTFLLHLGIETKTWTWLNWIACAFSILLFFSVALVYNTSCATCYPPSNPYWTMQTLLGDPVFYLTCLIAPVTALLPRLFFRALQGSLFPTQLQLGRQSAKKSPRKPSIPEDTFAQGHLPEDPSTELSEGNMNPPKSLSKDCVSQTPQCVQQPACSPEASGEPGSVDTSVPFREDTLLEGLGAQAPGTSMLGEAISEEYPGNSKKKPTSASRAAPLSSLFNLPNFSSLNWISSLSLVSGLGSVLQFSRSSLQMDKPDSEFLSSSPQPDQDLHGLQGQVTDYF